MAEETQTESVTTEPVAIEPTSEPVPTPEPVVEPAQTEETPTAQPVEPLNSGTEITPEPEVSTPEPEPISAPELVSTPQPQVSTPPIIQTSLARELLIKARDVIQFRKRKKLEKIMGMFLKQASITNDDVEKLLHVSDATATRYLDQLEIEGKIRRVNTGKYSSYSRM